MTAFYRIYDVMYDSGVHVRVETFRSIKETPCGHWVVSQYGPTWLKPEELIKRKFAKWVSNTSVRRHCYPTIEQALHSFKKRKVSQQSRLHSQLEQVDLVLDQIDQWKEAKLDELSGGINLCQTETLKGMTWDR